VDNRAIPKPNDPSYHFSEDIVDQSIEMIGENLAVKADKPFFLYLAFGAIHAPIQVPASYITKYAGVFDSGWDAVRERRFQRQLELGVIPANSKLPPRNPGDPAWSDLTAIEQKVFARFMEAYAGFLEHTDDQIGRLIDFLRQNGHFDDTLIVLISDNGGAPEAGVRGNFARPYGDRMTVEEMHARLDDLGSRDSQPLYQRAWAMTSCAPFKFYKLWPFNGGVRTPLIVSWPSTIQRNGLRSQFVDIIDITPTILDVVGIKTPALFDGVDQMPMHGASIKSTFDNPDAGAPRTTQYFELWGSRSIYRDGWKALAFHTPGEDFERDQWELYNLRQDFTETTDLAAQHPQRLTELKALWWKEAAKNGALPLLEARGIRQRTYNQILAEPAE
jgi:arylsulfatase